MDEKRVLLISYYYKHKNAMASVRAVKLAKYLAKHDGCEVTVLTSNQIDTWTKQYLRPLPCDEVQEWYAPEVWRWTQIRKFIARRGRKARSRTPGNTSATKEKDRTSGDPRKGLKSVFREYVRWLYYFNVAKQEDICLFKGLREEYKRRDCPQFDTVIATYPVYGAFLMGIWMRKNGYCRQLIADFRDPLYNPGARGRKQEAAYDKKCLQNILNAADRAVCVSKGIADGIIQAIPNYKKPIAIITNGFDPDDVALNTREITFDKNKINFVYTGTLYHGKRCVDMLAEVLRELIEKGEITANSFSFEYAGPDFAELVAQLRCYGLEGTAVDHGFVSREESIAMQKKADALLLLTWNESAYQGVIPGKVFEYMAIGTVPIIALVTGDVVNSEVAQIIRETDAGYACEAAAPLDKRELREYALKLFKRNIVQTGNTEKYSYKEISNAYFNLM